MESQHRGKRYNSVMPGLGCWSDSSRHGSLPPPPGKPNQKNSNPNDMVAALCHVNPNIAFIFSATLLEQSLNVLW